MPRSTWVEFDGACDHVINRGDFRGWIFQDEGAKDAFALCFAEAEGNSMNRLDGRRSSLIS